jgi:predicted ATP-dependent serine protease
LSIDEDQCEKKMASRSRFAGQQATRKFTDRNEPFAVFEMARKRVGVDNRRLIFFYGVGGQGKSRLLQELHAKVAAEQPLLAISGNVDLQDVRHRTPDQALLQIRKTLARSAFNASIRMRFDAFDLA